MMHTEEQNRFLDKVMPEPNSGCWIWTASLQTGGYGYFKSKIWKTNKAHRIAYFMFKGQIPQGLQLDHLCRVRCCVNPDHLEPVTGQENCRRGETGSNMRNKTHCIRGHSLDDAYRWRGKRVCKKCRLFHNRKYLAKKRGKNA